MKTKILDLLERSFSTFVEGFLGVLVGVNFTDGAVNWKLILISAAAAGGLAVLKVLGVNASHVQAARAVVDKLPTEVQQNKIVKTADDWAEEVEKALRK